jgi:Pyruvate/2-oxoacid:ferredoxin oxidoreductase delta subunit
MRQQVPRRTSVVICEGPGSQPLGSTERYEITAGLLGAGYEVRRSLGTVSALISESEDAVLVGRFDRSTPFKTCTCAQTSGPSFVDLNGCDAGSVVERVDATRKKNDLPAPGAWTPWFPVIDYDLCTNCKQCLGFCLFGVFGSDAEDKIEVQRPERCKTGCPACSRVCPNAAIMFPKYAKAPVNGEPAPDGDGPASEPMKVNVSSLLGGDMHTALRSRTRRSEGRCCPTTEPGGGVATGIERLRAFQSELDIPDSVIAELTGDASASRSNDVADSSDAPGGTCSCCENPEECGPPAGSSEQDSGSDGAPRG